MNVTREILEEIGVVSVQVSEGGRDSLCFVRKYSGGSVELSLPPGTEFRAGAAVSVRTAFRDDGGGIMPDGGTECRVTDSGEGWCSVRPPDNAEGGLARIVRRLAELDALDEKYGRRKEPRIGIGRERFREFGLLSPQQKLFMRNPDLYVQPCAVEDVSLHGIRVITKFESRRMKGADNFSVHVVFSGPAESVVLNCHKVHARLRAARDGTPFASLSCQLLEPVHHTWKERVIKLIDPEKSSPET